MNRDILEDEADYEARPKMEQPLSRWECLAFVGALMISAVIAVFGTVNLIRWLWNVL